MTETLQPSGLWHVSLAVDDLIEQAGFSSDEIEPDIGCLNFKGRPVILSHVVDKEMVVSVEGERDADFERLMTGFSTVVGYAPFCSYNLQLEDGRSPLLPTYEWDKVDPAARYAELSSKSTVSNLMRL